MVRTATRRSDLIRRSLVLDDVDWTTYSQLLRTFAKRPGVRLAYDRGRLEIMTPLLAHDDGGDFVGDMVKTLALELGLPLKRGGSTTIRRRGAERGLEPDRCFWIANASRMAGRRRLDLNRDPPPDLAIEVDISHSSLDRMGIYAVLGVPEVWRLDGDSLTFHVLGSRGTYRRAARSRSFPQLTPADLLPFLQEARLAGDETPAILRFREWVRQRRSSESWRPR
jgi:Uma2 family endonuclease